MDTLGQALLVTAALSALGIIVGLAAVIVRAIALQRVLARVATGALSREAALARLSKVARTALSVVSGVAVVPSMFAFVIPLQFNEFVVDPHLWIGVYIIVSSLTIRIYNILASAILVPWVGRELRGTTLTAAESTLPAMKSWLVNGLPLVFSTIGLSLSFADGSVLGVCFFCLLSLASIIATVFFAGRFYCFTNSASLVDPVAALGLTERIARWAARCDVAPPKSYIVRTANFGSAFVIENGVFGRTLLMSDNLSANTDWRQQDAFIVRAIEGNKLAPQHAMFITAVYAGVFGLIAILFTVPNFHLPVAAASLFALALLLYAPFLHRTKPNVARASLLRIDRLTAEITGDPLAVMVGMKTLNALNVPTGAWSGAGTVSVSIDDRMRALDAWMQQPGPRAPWAYQPVPSRWPVTIGSYLLTAPLESAPPPAPVPTAPYPALAPATPAAP